MAAVRPVRARIDGWPLAVHVSPSVGPPVGRALLLHAMMADARSLDRPAGEGLASTLARAGLEVWRADFRGHGASGPGAAEGATWRYDELVRRDLPALVDAARAADGLPLALVGHSLGGHTAVAACVEGVRPDALVLLATNVWRPSHEPSRRLRVRKALALRAFVATARLVGRFPTRGLRMGPVDEAADYVADLASFWLRDAFASQDGRDWGAALAALPPFPILSVGGAGDALYATPGCVARFAAAFGPDRAEVWIARAGELGCAWDPDHMGLACDPRSAPVWARIGSWLRNALGRATGPASEAGFVGPVRSSGLPIAPGGTRVP